MRVLLDEHLPQRLKQVLLMSIFLQNLTVYTYQGDCKTGRGYFDGSGVTCKRLSSS